MKQKSILRIGTIGKSFKEWRGHKVYADMDYFYDTNKLEFCEKCGSKLEDEEIVSCYESRGEFWGASCSENVVTGYKCGKYGFKMDF